MEAVSWNMDKQQLIKNRRLLSVDRYGLVSAKGYCLYCHKTNDIQGVYYASIRDGINTMFASAPLLNRLMRAEITRYYRLKDRSELCIARKGIFRRGENEKTFKKVFNVIRGSRPMNICENIDGTLFFGEYFANMEKQVVHIYKSTDSGQSWEICYTFPKGNINHVHGIFLDPYTTRMWFVTGDRENECIIGYTEDGFKTVKEVFRGGQEFRSCVLFFYKDFIVYGTDSQYQQNELKCFDRQTLEIKVLQQVQGPVIKGVQFGDVAMISTDVEPSDINKDKNAYVWITKDGLNWRILCQAEKDSWNPTLFQFGVFDLPQYANDYNGDKVYVTGKAVKGCGGDTLVFKVK